MSKNESEKHINQALEHLLCHCLAESALHVFNALEICQGKCFGEADDDGFFPWVYNDEAGTMIYQPSFCLRILAVSNLSPDLEKIRETFKTLSNISQETHIIVWICVMDMNPDDSFNEDLLKVVDSEHNEYPNASIYLRTLDELIARINYSYYPDIENEFTVYNELEKFVEKYSNHDMQYYDEMKV